jgi:hypothetical protein
MTSNLYKFIFLVVVGVTGMQPLAMIIDRDVNPTKIKIFIGGIILISVLLLFKKIIKIK